MANITITVPDDKVPRLRDAFAERYGWTSDLGISKAEFARQQIIKFCKQVMKDSEANLQAGQTRITVENEIDNITIT